jgi:spermidine synthase
VRFVVDEGRSWFARSTEKFDLIQMSMIDTFAATGAGAFSLSENGLYTVEGWKTFLSALNPNGLFTVSRWHSPRSTVELGRVGGFVQNPRVPRHLAQ